MCNRQSFAFDQVSLALLLRRPPTVWITLVGAGHEDSTLVNYGARYRKGLPISSSIAESAVNLLVSHRMAKKQQMRWTNEGAHHLVQVRVAALNGELTPQRLANLSRMPCANASQARQVA